MSKGALQPSACVPYTVSFPSSKSQNHLILPPSASWPSSNQFLILLIPVLNLQCCSSQPFLLIPLAPYLLVSEIISLPLNCNNGILTILWHPSSPFTYTAAKLISRKHNSDWLYTLPWLKKKKARIINYYSWKGPWWSLKPSAEREGEGKGRELKPRNRDSKAVHRTQWGRGLGGFNLIAHADCTNSLSF